MAALDAASILPFPFSITADDPSTCPSSSAILGTFAAVNVVMSILSLVTGHRLVNKVLSCGMLGGKEYSGAWKYVWILPFGLQLGANAVVGVLISRAPGYTVTNLNVGDLVLLYSARPRLSWIVLTFVSLWPRKPKKAERRRGRRPRSPAARQEWELVPSTERVGEQKRGASAHSTRYDDNDEGDTVSDTRLPSYWHCTALSQLVAEVVLEVLALVTMGRTVRFGAVRGFYNVGSEAYRSLPQPAHVMYGGAMWYLVAGLMLVPQSLILIWCFARRRARSDQREDQVDVSGHYMYFILFWINGLLGTWVSSWLFWSGYIEVAQER